MTKSFNDRVVRYENTIILFDNNTDVVEKILGLESIATVFAGKVTIVRKRLAGLEVETSKITESKNNLLDKMIPKAISLANKLQLVANEKDLPTVMSDIEVSLSNMLNGGEQSCLTRVEKIIERATEQQTDGEKYGITKQAISELSALKDAYMPRKGQPKHTTQERAADKKRFQETLQDLDKYFKGFVLPVVKGEALGFPDFYEKFKATILVQHTPGTRVAKQVETVEME